MKLNLKMIAAAAAFAAAGSAQADIQSYNTGNGGFSVYAFNTATRAYYIRDLGMLLNQFITNSVTPLVGDNGGIAGTATPEAGLNLSYSDPAFSTWLTGQNTANIRWAVSSGDALSAGLNGVSRMVTSMATFGQVFNAGVTNYVGGPNGGGLPALFGVNSGISTTHLTTSTGSSSLLTWADGNGILQPASLATLDQGVGLYYFARTAQTGGSSTPATTAQYANSLNAAVVTLASNGDFTYALAPAVAAVPLPASIWLMGAGLAAVGGMVRRRKAAAQA